MGLKVKGLRVVSVRAKTPFLASAKFIDPFDRRKMKSRPVAVGKPTVLRSGRKLFPVTLKF